MNILVLIKMVPDIVEELEIGPDAKSLDFDAVRPFISERYEHALEQALLLKERCGGTVTAVAIDSPGSDDVLFSALAKGCDRAVKLTGLEMGLGTHGAAACFAEALGRGPGLWPADLVLTGVQAIDDLDGLLAPLVAEWLRLPYLGIVSGIAMGADGKTAVVGKEYPSGVRGKFEVPLPAVLGIQASEKPPRYVPVARVRAIMKAQKIDSVATSAERELGGIEVLELAKPEATGRAEFLEGTPEEVADQLCEILAKQGVL